MAKVEAEAVLNEIENAYKVKKEIDEIVTTYLMKDNEVYTDFFDDLKINKLSSRVFDDLIIKDKISNKRLKRKFPPVEIEGISGIDVDIKTVNEEIDNLYERIINYLTNPKNNEHGYEPLRTCLIIISQKYERLLAKIKTILKDNLINEIRKKREEFKKNEKWGKYTITNTTGVYNMYANGFNEISEKVEDIERAENIASKKFYNETHNYSRRGGGTRRVKRGRKGTRRQ